MNDESKVKLYLYNEHKGKKGKYNIYMQYIVEGELIAEKRLNGEIEGNKEDLAYETLRVGLEAMKDRVIRTLVYVNFNCKRTDWLDDLVHGFHNITFIDFDYKDFTFK